MAHEPASLFRTGINGRFAADHLAGSPSAQAAVTVGHLTCEYRTDPIGIDTATPRLGWWIESSKHGERQTAYQVLVASSPEKLTEDYADLWNSGRVESEGSDGFFDNLIVKGKNGATVRSENFDQSNWQAVSHGEIGGRLKTGCRTVK